ncbi:MAG: hypothetical protein DMG05_30030 [Acidobacteria bacterium]|nr:MAG: hypothetical protein DMG05_30030 [Acidobacteriota bacterium]
MILTNGTTLAVLYTILSGASEMSFLLLGSTLAVRLTMSWLIGVRWLGDEILRKYIWLVPARDVLSFFIWCLGMAGKKVEWRGGRFELLNDGKMEARHETEFGRRSPRGDQLGFNRTGILNPKLLIAARGPPPTLRLCS